MDSNKWITLTIGFMVGAVILASFVPIFVEVQDDAGESITLANDSSIVLREVKAGDILTSERTVITQGASYSDKWFLNSEELTNIGQTFLTWNVGIISDAIYLQIQSGGSSPTAGVYYDMTRVNPASLSIGAGNLEAGQVATWSAEFDNGVVTVTDRLGNETEYSYTWAYVVCNFEDGEYYSAETGGAGICKSANDLILCGAYTSGNLDTMYSFVNGVSYVSNDNYTMTVNAPLTKHTGTTDIYDISVNVDMSDGVDTENFTPYRIFLPYEVSGHATKGAMYDIFGLLPLIAGVGLLLVACIEFLRRY